MTAQTSTGKKSFMLSYYLFKLRKNKNYLILNIILSILVIPLLTIYGSVCIRIMNSFADCTSIYEIDGSYKVFQSLKDSEAIFIVISVVAFIAAAIMAVAVVNGVFSYNIKKCDADMYLSLPVSANQRFFADLGVTASICVVPMAVSGIVSFILSSLFSVGADRAITELSSDTPNIYTFSYYNARQVIFNDFSGTIAYFMLMTVIVMLGTVLFSALINSVCGRQSDAVAYTVIGALIIPLAAFVLYAVVTDGIVGAVMTDYDLLFVAPIGTAISGIKRFFEVISNSSDFGMFDIFSLQNVLMLLVVFAGYIILAFLANKNRKAEKTGSHFVFPVAYHIITIGLLFSIFGLLFCKNVLGYSFNNTEIVITVILTAVGYIIFELVRGIGLKKLWQSALRYALAVGCTFLLCFTIKTTGAFGYSGYIPSVDMIDSVTVNSGLICNDGGKNDIYKFESKEMIAAIRDYQLYIIEQGSAQTANTYMSVSTDCAASRYENYTIIYKLKNGRTFARSYDLTITKDSYADYAKSLYDMMQECYKSEEYFDNLRKTIEGAMQPEVIIHYDHGDVFGKKLAPELVDKLLTALHNDLSAGRNTGRLKAVIGVNEYSGFDRCELISVEVRENCTETLAVLNNESNSSERKQEYYDYKKEIAKGWSDNIEDNYDPCAYILAFGDNICILSNYGAANTTQLQLRFKDLETEEIKELEKLYRLHDYYCDGPIFEAGAIMWGDNALFSGANYYIPKENKALSGGLIDRLSEKLDEDQIFSYE